MFLRRSVMFFALMVAVMIIQSATVNGQSCGVNEVYNECGTQCPRICADVGKPDKMCNHMCALGCFCVPGYVRKTDVNSPCVKEAEC